MKVENMTSAKGNNVANQFIISGITEQGFTEEYFQSYETTIARNYYDNGLCSTTLDTNALNYSRTTSKYLYQFLGEGRKEIEAKIKSGEYVVTDLNA